MDDTHFNLVGKKAGITTVFVRDEAEQELSLTVTVVQADKVAYLGSGNYFKVPFEYNGVVDESLKILSAITFEARFNIESLNGNDNGNARINTVMGIEKNSCCVSTCIREEAMMKNASFSYQQMIKVVSAMRAQRR